MNRPYTYRLFDVPLDPDDLLEATVLLGLAKSSGWPIDSRPQAISPRVETIPEVFCYLPVTVRDARRVAEPVEPLGITIGDKHYQLDNIGTQRYLCFETTIEHNQILAPSFRIAALFKDIVFKPGVDPYKAIYLTDEVQEAEWFYCNTFRPVYRQENLTQDVKIVVFFGG